MSWRIKLYLATVTFRHWGTAALFFLDDQRFEQNPTFNVLFSVASIEVWIVILTFVGSMAVASIILQPRFVLARLTAVATVALSFAWAACFGLIRLDEPHSSALLLILYASLALKDLAVSGMQYSDIVESISDPGLLFRQSGAKGN